MYVTEREGPNWTSIMCPVTGCHTLHNMGLQDDPNTDVNGRFFCESVIINGYSRSEHWMWDDR